MYKTYAANHEHATEFLDKFKAQSRYEPAMLAIKQNPQFRAPDLASYLIMPIQRIPRYRLLLADLFKHTPEGHPDHDATAKALELIGDVATAVNEAIKGQQNRHTVLRIAQSFTSDLDIVTPSRRFVRQGTLTKRCRARNIDYEFFLFNDLLIYASRTATGKNKLHREISINKRFLVTSLEDEPPKLMHRFQIVNSIKSFEVLASSKEEKEVWLLALAECVAEQTTRITGAGAAAGTAGAAAAGDGGILAPVWQNDNTSSNCTNCRVEFTLFNRRHHCRRCGGLVCDKCSRSRMCLPSSPNTKERICDDCVRLLSNNNNSGSSSGSGSANAANSAAAAAAAASGGPVSPSGTPARPPPPSSRPAPPTPLALNNNNNNNAGAAGAAGSGPAPAAALSPLAAAIASKAAQMAASRQASASMAAANNAGNANGGSSNAPASAAATPSRPSVAPPIPPHSNRAGSTAHAPALPALPVIAPAPALMEGEDSTDSEEEEEVAEALRNEAEIAAAVNNNTYGTLGANSGASAANGANAAAAATAAGAAAAAGSGVGVVNENGEVVTPEGVLRPYMVCRALYAYVSAQPGTCLQNMN